MSAQQVRECPPSAAASLFSKVCTPELAVLERPLDVPPAATQSSSRGRSRSRSGQRSEGEVSRSPSPCRESREETAVNARQQVWDKLSQETRDRLQMFEDDGTVRPRELDINSLSILSTLSAELQIQVVDHMEAQRVFFVNSRSKSGFLVAQCEKARAGQLDARGHTLADPWRDVLLAVARPNRSLIVLVPEQEWLEKHGQEPARLIVDISADAQAGMSSIVLTVKLDQSPETIKKRLAVAGISIPLDKMRLKSASVGFMKDHHTLAFYNLMSGAHIQLVRKSRAGASLRKDHSNGYDPELCAGTQRSHIAI